MLENIHNKIIAVDFDDTITSGGIYPITGQVNTQMVEFLKKLKHNGNRLILWTCRYGDSLDEAINICRDCGLNFDAINENIDSRITSNKIFADYYIDDKAINVNDIM